MVVMWGGLDNIKVYEQMAPLVFEMSSVPRVYTNEMANLVFTPKCSTYIYKRNGQFGVHP